METKVKPGSSTNNRFTSSDKIEPVERTCLRDDASDSAEAFAQLLYTVNSVRESIESATTDSAAISAVLQETVRRVLTLTAHLDDGAERANVFNVVASSAEGAAMQQAINILRDSESRCEAAMRESPAMGNEEYSKIDPETVAVDQIAIEHNVTKCRADRLLLNAILVHRCTRIWNSMMRGEVTAETSVRIARELQHVLDPMRRAEIEARILALAVQEGRCARWSTGMTKKLHKIIGDVDPDALKADDKEAEEGRRVNTWSPNAAETVVSANLPTVDANAVWSAVDGLAAKWSHAEGDKRTVSQRRADALVQMVTGIDKRPEGDTTPIGSHCCTPHVTLLADVGADRARDRAVTAGGSTVRRRLDDLLDSARKATLTVVPFASEEDEFDIAGLCASMTTFAERLAEETTYKPSAALRRLVVERDGTCRFPGCSVAAHKCDLDHVDPFNHDNPFQGGLTREDNLIALCRRHHRNKTHGSTVYLLGSDGTVSVNLGQGTEGISEPNGHRGISRQQRGLEYRRILDDYVTHLGALCDAAAAILEILEKFGLSATPSPSSSPASTAPDGPVVADFTRGQSRAKRRKKETEQFRAGAEDRKLRRMFGANALDPVRLAEFKKPPPF